MAPSGPPLVPPTIHETFGAGLIGALVNAMMYGLTTLQTYLFYLYYPNDSIGNKIMVATIWVIDTFHTALVSLCIYFYLVTNYDNPGGLTKGHWSLFISILCNVILACIVQAFFTYRIHQLASPRIRWWLSSIIGITVFAHLVFGVETVAFCFIKQDFARLHEFTIIAATPFAITAVLSDVMIAGSLCILLHGSRTGFRNTNTLVTTLIIYAINRCLLTSAVAIAEVIIFSIKPHAYWYLAVDFVIGKLWANSLLATLNSRLALQNMSSGEANGGSGALISDIEFESRRSGKDTRRPGHLVSFQGDTKSTGNTNTTYARTVYSEDIKTKDSSQTVELVAGQK